MSPSEIFCTYIYGVFVTVDAALQVGMKLAQTALSTLNAFFDAILNLFRFVIDLTVQTIIDGVRVIQKKLCDMIWDDSKAQKWFCENLFKCNIFVEQLTDENSLIASTLIKLGVLTPEQVQFAGSIVSDYNSFKETVCTYGFTFNFGLSYLKKSLQYWKGVLEGVLDTVERKKDDIRRLIQGYINKLMDSGIFDLMAKLRKFFDCVLEETGVCGDIATAKKTYATGLEKMHIEEDGCGGYKLKSEDSAKFMNACDSRLNLINNAKSDLQKAIDAILNPADVKAASKAFNLSSKIFPGGMSWTDIKNGNWKKNSMVKYFCAKGTQFAEAFLGKHKELDDLGVSTNFVLNGMTINDEKGIIKVKLPNGTEETIDMNDRSTFRDYNLDSGQCIIEEYACNDEYYVDVDAAQDDEDGVILTPDGQIMSIRRAAFEIASDPNSELAIHCRNVYNGLVNGFISSREVVEQW